MAVARVQKLLPRMIKLLQEARLREGFLSRPAILGEVSAGAGHPERVVQDELARARRQFELHGAGRPGPAGDQGRKLHCHDFLLQAKLLLEQRRHSPRLPIFGGAGTRAWINHGWPDRGVLSSQQKETIDREQTSCPRRSYPRFTTV